MNDDRNPWLVAASDTSNARFDPIAGTLDGIPIRTSIFVPKNMVIMTSDNGIEFVRTAVEYEHTILMLMRPRRIALARYRRQYERRRA